MDPLGRSFAARYWALVREAVVTVFVAIVLVVVLTEFFVHVYGGVLTWFGVIFAVAAAASALGLGLLAARLRWEHSHERRVAWVALVGLVAAVLSIGGMMVFAAAGGTGVGAARNDGSELQLAHPLRGHGRRRRCLARLVGAQGAAGPPGLNGKRTDRVLTDSNAAGHRYQSARNAKTSSAENSNASSHR